MISQAVADDVKGNDMPLQPSRQPIERLESQIACERAWHDAKYDAMRSVGAQAVPAGAEYRPSDVRAGLLYALEQLGDVRDKQILELGAGLGWASIVLAHRGAQVLATDVSPRSIEIIQQRATASGVAAQVQAQVMPAEHLDLPDASVDGVFGRAVLHHLDLTVAAREFARVLRPGGRAVFLEPLSENSVLDFARDYLPYRQKRSPKGHRGITREAVTRTGADFASVSVRAFYLTAMLNRVFGHNVSITSLERVDAWLLRARPALGRICRYCVVTYEQADETASQRTLVPGTGLTPAANHGEPGA